MVCVLKSKRTIYLVSAVRFVPLLLAAAESLAVNSDEEVTVAVGGVLTSCITPEYQRPSGPGAQTFVPIIERLAKRRPVDIVFYEILETEQTEKKRKSEIV